MTRARLFGRSDRQKGFTLVELLVVIGIIAILIGILLPGLASARRSANRVKCSAALRELGNAFQMYTNEFKGVYPVAVHEKTAPHIKIDVERRWYDLLAKYITKKNISTYSEIVQIRENSVIWGCPEWARKDFPFESGDDVRPGFGMQYYPGQYFENVQNGMTTVGNLVFLTDYAYVTTSGRGLYVKEGRWKKRGAERGILIDSMTHIVNVPGFGVKYDYSAVVTGGWQPAKSGNILTGTPTGTAFYVDAGRHLKPGQKVNDKIQGMNMLFCDGHVSPVSVREAWSAITMKGVP